MIRAIVVALCLAAPALADAQPTVLDLPRTLATIEVPAGWTKLEVPGVVASYRSPGGLVLAVTRVPVPNPEAWRAKTREAYVNQIERGAIAVMPGGKRTARKLATVHGVPALDLELAREDGTIVVMRVLLFRSYAYTAAVAVPSGVGLDEARAIAATLMPPRKP